MRPPGAILLASMVVLLPATVGALPDAFEGIRLGSSQFEVEDALQSSVFFYYRGAPDVTLRPGTTDLIYEVEGLAHIRDGLFQFRDGSLFSITIRLRERSLDFYSVYTTLREKYGEPTDVHPQRIRWEDELVRMDLERPLTLRYVDREAFEQMLRDAEIIDDYDEVTRDAFLDRL